MTHGTDGNDVNAFLPDNLLTIKNIEFMKKFLFIFILGSILLTGCEQESVLNLQPEKNNIVFKLHDTAYQNEASSRSSNIETSEFDLMEFYIMDHTGRPAEGIKSKYNPLTKEIIAEGMLQGEYTLLVLGVKGDATNDGATISKLNSTEDVWISFPQEMDKPLKSEYFYARAPFNVSMKETANGNKETVTMEQDVIMTRIVGRMDVACEFNNPYVENASFGSKLRLSNAVFYTSFKANGEYKGETSGELEEIDLDNNWSFYFLPSVNQTEETDGGEVIIRTRTYRNETIQRSFSFRQIPVTANRITKVNLQITHPDDSRGTLFVTENAYNANEHGLILQDDELPSVYTDPNQRSFSALEPLQLEITDDNRFHARFYCPRPMRNVTVKAYIPSVTKEKMDFAFFDLIPGLGDVYLEIPLLNKSAIFYTESGKQIRINTLTPEFLKEATFTVESDDECWRRLSQIKYNYGISSFSLYGGDPSKPDGGANGNWKAIRPVHCREAVAIILNVAFMLSQDEEMETLMKAHESTYVDDNGNPVSAEKLLSQLRQGYQLKVGLVNAANSNTVGMASAAGLYGLAQNRFLYHYDTNWAPTTIYHELGHVMGYDHKSTLTYGYWSEQVVNKYYMEHISEFPIDSHTYLNSRNNPNLYDRN